MKLQLDIEEIKRYMNYTDPLLDSVTRKKIDKAKELIEIDAQPRFCFEVYSLSLVENALLIGGDALAFRSDDLSQHLARSQRVMILAVTLGVMVDRQIKRLELTDLSLAFVYNCVAVEYMEKFCDYIGEKLAALYAEDKYYFTSRFSPGYGDVPLSLQGPILSLVNANKNIGISLTNNDIMLPTKSVTAFIGLQREKDTKGIKKCELCLPSGKCSGKCLEVFR